MEIFGFIFWCIVYGFLIRAWRSGKFFKNKDGDGITG